MITPCALTPVFFRCGEDERHGSVVVLFTALAGASHAKTLWVAEVDFNTALIFPDTRKEYGETRYIALCHLDGRLHVLCFTETGMGC